ncbi:MAG: class I SAM-dependent methyltransferase [Polyangiaceae bacterium]
MSTEHVCNICDPKGLPIADPEIAEVRPNIRRLQNERFHVWRCPKCNSIHAEEEVDLDFYYRDYPFLALAMDWRVRAMYASQLGRLKAAGLKRDARILDYGCGAGKFVEYLRSCGYTQAMGYDAYSTTEFGNPAVLEKKYDCIISQDVIEHVPSPWELLHTFEKLVEPGAIIAIGTPEAGAIDLKRTDDFIHPLHQPFHRHILSKEALIGSAEKLGWKLSRYYPTMYANTMVPFINSRFVFHFMKCGDDTIDVVFGPIDLKNPKLWTLQTLYYGLFGYFHAPHTDVMAVFHTPRGLPARS